jgi:hypothetical protein
MSKYTKGPDGVNPCCNIYATNPLLKDVKTKADEQLQNTVCQWASMQETGPFPTQPGQK